MLKKNDTITLPITDIGTGGEGIGRFEGYAFFVKDALPGDEVEAVITKMNKGYGFAKTIKVLKPSASRVEPPCPHASRCGGCQIMQLDYKEQLKFKENKVRNDLERIGGVKDYTLRPIIGMNVTMPVHFRNKVQIPVGRDSEGRAITGFYAGRTHYIIAADDCAVAADITGEIVRKICEFIDENGLSVYDEKTGEGLIRHILIRTGTFTGQIMVCLVINGDTLDGSDLLTPQYNADKHMQVNSKHDVTESLQVTFANMLTGSFPDIASICLNINKKNTNVILGDKTVCIYGMEYIEDMIDDLTFRISPRSFFQINAVQTQKLYGKALEYADLTGSETVWDLYCGAGTISLFLARRAKQVYGVEIVQEAIDNARENAALNGIENAEFICGKSEEIFPGYYGHADNTGMPANQKSQDHVSADERLPAAGDRADVPDVVVLDPPRKGCDRTLLEAILKTAPKRIVYVSCNSATLARDIKILSEKYRLVEATPVDMFPHSVHCEVVVSMSRTGSWL